MKLKQWRGTRQSGLEPFALLSTASLPRVATEPTLVGLTAATRAPRRCCLYEEKLAALRLESEEKDLGAMAWVLKMDDATIESGLVHDFDASLSGIGQELGAGAYSMRLEQLSKSP